MSRGLALSRGADCGGQHALDTLAGGSASRRVREMLCLLGAAMGSFSKADLAARKLLGLRVSESFIRRLCHTEGRHVQVPPREIPADGSVRARQKRRDG